MRKLYNIDKKNKLLFFVLVSAFAAFLLLWGISLVINNFGFDPERIKQWPVSEAVVVDSDVYESCSSNKMGRVSCTSVPIHTYIYLANGKQEKSTTTSTLYSPSSKGTYKVYYNPEKPSQSYLERDLVGISKLDGWPPIISGIFFIGLALYALLSAIKSFFRLDKNKKIENPFTCFSNGESIGVDCTRCVHCKQPEQWPDMKKSISCKLHNISIASQLNDKGYKKNDCFCVGFEDNGKSDEYGLEEYNEIVEELFPEVLYSCNKTDEFLNAIEFKQLKNL